MKAALWRHSLPLTDCTWITVGLLDLWKVMSRWTSLNVDQHLVCYCHLVRRLSWTAHNSLGCTAQDMLVTAFPLRLLHNHVYTGCTWKSLYTEDSLIKMNLQKRSKWNRLINQDETDHTTPTVLVNVEINGLPITTDGVKVTIAGTQWWLCMTLWSSFLWCSDWTLLCWLNYWSLDSSLTEDVNTCTLHHVWNFTVHVDYSTFFSASQIQLYSTDFWKCLFESNDGLDSRFGCLRNMFIVDFTNWFICTFSRFVWTFQFVHLW